MKVYKKINEYKNYIVSNEGNVLSIYSKRELKVQMDRKKYPYVTLYKNKKAKHERVHILVARTFISNPEKKEQVNHIDGNVFNFHVDNLEWSTASENMLHAFANGLSIPIDQQMKIRKTAEELASSCGMSLDEAIRNIKKACLF